MYYKSTAITESEDNKIVALLTKCLTRKNSEIDVNPS